MKHVDYQNLFLNEMGIENDVFDISPGIDLYQMADMSININWMNTKINEDVRELATSIVSFLTGKSKKRHPGIRKYIQPISNIHYKLPRGIKFDDVVVSLDIVDGDIHIINQQNSTFSDNIANFIVETIIGDDKVISMFGRRFIDVYYDFYMWRKNKAVVNVDGEVYSHIEPPSKGNNILTFSNSLSARKKDIRKYIEYENHELNSNKHKRPISKDVSLVDYYTNKILNVDFNEPGWFGMVGSSESKAYDIKRTNRGDKVIRTPMTIIVEENKKKRRSNRGKDIFSKNKTETYSINGKEYDVYGRALDGQLPFWTQYYTYGNARYAIYKNSIVALSSDNRVISPDGTVTNIRVKLVDYTTGRSVMLMASNNGELMLNVTRLGKNYVIATVPFGRVNGVLLIGDKYLGKGVCGRLEDLYKNSPEEFHTLTVPNEINVAIDIVDEILNAYKNLDIQVPVIYTPNSFKEENGKLYVKDTLYANCTLEEYNSQFSTLNNVRLEDYLTLTLVMTCGTYNGSTLNYKVVSIKHATFTNTGEYVFDIPKYTPSTSVVKLYTALKARHKKISMSIPNYYGGAIALSNDTIQALQNSPTFCDERQVISRQLCKNHYIMGKKSDDVFNEYLEENKNLFETLVGSEYGDKLEMDNLLNFDNSYDLGFSKALNDIDNIEIDGESVVKDNTVTYTNVLMKHEKSKYTNEYFYLEGGINCLPFKTDAVKFVDFGSIEFVRYIPTYKLHSLDANGIFWRCNNKLIVRIDYNGSPRFYMHYQGEYAEPFRTMKDTIANHEIPIGGTLSITKDDAYLVDIYTGKKYAYTGTYLTSNFASSKHCVPKNTKSALRYFAKLRRDLVPIPKECEKFYPIYTLGEIKTDSLTMFDS